MGKLVLFVSTTQYFKKKKLKINKNKNKNTYALIYTCVRLHIIEATLVFKRVEKAHDRSHCEFSQLINIF
jgi:hypothetical protein